MKKSRAFVEEIFLYAPIGETEFISKALRKEFALLEPELSLQSVSQGPLGEDEMGLKNYWLQHFGERINPKFHTLSRISFYFTSNSSMSLDELSVRTYEVVSHVLRSIDGIEYFSSFAEDGG